MQNPEHECKDKRSFYSKTSASNDYLKNVNGQNAFAWFSCYTCLVNEWDKDARYVFPLPPIPNVIVNDDGEGGLIEIFDSFYRKSDSGDRRVDLLDHHKKLISGGLESLKFLKEIKGIPYDEAVSRIENFSDGVEERFGLVSGFFPKCEQPVVMEEPINLYLHFASSVKV